MAVKVCCLLSYADYRGWSLSLLTEYNDASYFTERFFFLSSNASVNNYIGFWAFKNNYFVDLVYACMLPPANTVKLICW